MVSLSRDRALWRYALTDLTGLAFAALWGARGVRALGLPLWANITIIGVVTLPLALGFLTRDLSRRRPEIVIDHALARHARRGRFIMLFLAGMTLSMIHRPDLMLVISGVIIGASYLPLGRAMGEPVHIMTGTGILLVTLTSFFLEQPMHSVLAGLGTALCCWAGATARLWRALPEPEITPFTPVESNAR